MEATEKPKSGYEYLKENNARLEAENEQLKKQLADANPSNVLMKAKFYWTSFAMAYDRNGDYFHFIPQAISKTPDEEGNYIIPIQ